MSLWKTLIVPKEEKTENKKNVAARNGTQSVTALFGSQELYVHHVERITIHDILYPSVAVPLPLFEWYHSFLMMVDCYLHVHLWPSLHVTRLHKRLKLIRRR